MLSRFYHFWAVDGRLLTRPFPTLLSAMLPGLLLSQIMDLKTHEFLMMFPLFCFGLAMTLFSDSRKDSTLWNSANHKNQGANKSVKRRLKWRTKIRSS